MSINDFSLTLGKNSKENSTKVLMLAICRKCVRYLGTEAEMRN